MHGISHGAELTKPAPYLRETNGETGVGVRRMEMLPLLALEETAVLHRTGRSKAQELWARGQLPNPLSWWADVSVAPDGS